MKCVLLFVGTLGCGGALVSSGSPSSSGPSSGAADDGGGWSLEERQFWQELQEEMDEFARKANDHCHSQISAAYNKDAFRGMLTAGGNYGLHQDVRTRCTSALSAILAVCGDGDMAKKAVASKIQRVQCDWGQPTYVLQNGTFFTRIDTSNDQVSYYQRGMEDVLRKSL